MLVHRHDPPDRFVVGTVGEPGERTFFLQARTGRLVTSVSLEKQQVSILAERIVVLLDELERSGDLSADGLVAADAEPLEQPLVEEFRVGTMTLSWDGDDARVVIEAFPVGEEEPGASDDPDAGEGAQSAASEVLVVRLAPPAARGFASRAETIVSAGRPPCPFCGQPLDPEGHLCPRANGYKRVDR
ncbi:MAG: DUF3090 domain-containing protein [Nocardioidaceae bacterium]|nr:DUF3090 domain-containing protein [Nocardioidaceae bacterium]